MSSIQIIEAEIEEGVAMLRSSFPDATDEELRRRAEYRRPFRYQLGHWPSEEELAALIKKMRQDGMYVREEAAETVNGTVVPFPTLL